jgi:hypothetical protein
MPTIAPRNCCFAFLILVALAGCSGDPAPPPATGGNETISPPGKAADTADAAVRAVIEGLQRNHPEALWDFLPQGFQSDVNELVHDFANRMDPEIWLRGVEVVRKVGVVIKAQKALLSPAPGQPATLPRTDWDGVATLIHSLAQSELGDLDKLKRADARHILSVTGVSLMKQWDLLSNVAAGERFSGQLSQLSQIRATLVSSSGDRAVVRIERPDEDPVSTEFVRVEGKWIPRTLADGWIEAMGEARARLSLLGPDNMGEIKPRVMKLLSSVNEMLDQLAAARDASQFQAATLAGLAALHPLFLELAGPGTETGSDEPPAERPLPPTARIITVIVRSKLTSAEQDALADRLKRTLATEERLFLEVTADDETTSIKLGPVDDIEALAKELDFIEVDSVDRQTRTISAKVTRPSQKRP